MSMKSIRARSTMKASARLSAGAGAHARPAGGPGITTAELEAALGDLYQAPSLKGIDLID